MRKRISNYDFNIEPRHNQTLFPLIKLRDLMETINKCIHAVRKFRFIKLLKWQCKPQHHEGYEHYEICYQNIIELARTNSVFEKLLNVYRLQVSTESVADALTLHNHTAPSHDGHWSYLNTIQWVGVQTQVYTMQLTHRHVPPPHTVSVSACPNKHDAPYWPKPLPPTVPILCSPLAQSSVLHWPKPFPPHWPNLCPTLAQTNICSPLVQTSAPGLKTPTAETGLNRGFSVVF